MSPTSDPIEENRMSNSECPFVNLLADLIFTGEKGWPHSFVFCLTQDLSRLCCTPNCQRGVHGSRAGPSAVCHSKAHVGKILQAALTEQLDRFYQPVPHRLRLFGGLDTYRSSPSGFVGVLSRIWTAIVWARGVLCHPDIHCG
ncbi:uncharacterized protein ACBT44_015922 isoform 2-T3 [Syngnathus typhle]